MSGNTTGGSIQSVLEETEPGGLIQRWATSREGMQAKGEREYVNPQTTATPLLHTWHHS